MKNKTCWIVVWFTNFNAYVGHKVFASSQLAHQFKAKINEGGFHAEVYREKIREILPK